jgi:hypothetical protein
MNLKLKHEERYVVQQELEIFILKGDLSLYKMNISSDFEKVKHLSQGQTYRIKNDRIYILFNDEKDESEFLINFH